MVNVCAKYCGTTILLDSFENENDANEFMKHEYVLHYADELENGESDDIIYPNEMFIEDELPFFEETNVQLNSEDFPFDPDELPF